MSVPHSLDFYYFPDVSHYIRAVYFLSDLMAVDRFNSLYLLFMDQTQRIRKADECIKNGWVGVHFNFVRMFFLQRLKYNDVIM